MSSDSSRRTSTASTSSIPRTPASIHREFDGYNWTDSGRLPLVGSFTSPVFEAELASTSSCTSITPALSHHGPLTRIGEEVDPSWQLDPKYVPVRALSVSSPAPVQYDRLSRSATYHSTTHHPSVRLWPQPPSHAANTAGPDLLEEARNPARPEQDLEEEDSGKDSRAGSPDSESDTLRRRRHIKRPSRQKPNLPRPLPPLPSSIPGASHATVGRFATLPPAGTGILNETNESAYAPDGRPRANTMDNLPSSIRPLPQISTGTTPQRRKPTAQPKLRLSTLELRSNPSEVAAVLTKTPNRPTNPLGGFTVAPPLPADASAQIDWDLIEDVLEADIDGVAALELDHDTRNNYLEF